MKIVLGIFVILNICFVKSSLQTTTEDVLKVSLYYESLCPGCQAFITQQLYPSYKKIGSSLLLDLTPYGNARRTRVNGTWVFDCQHGPAECAINKIEACGLAKDNKQDEIMEFVYCIESHVQTEKIQIKKIAKCASKLGITVEEILKCSQGPEGNELLTKLADKQQALDPKLMYVPWIIFNDQPHNEALQNKAMDHFLKTACDLLSDKPDGCSEINEIN